MLDCDPILRRYPAPFQPQRIEALGNAGGFSGSDIWRLDAPAGRLCLRCWPAETTAARIEEIHTVLQHAAQTGLTFLPIPIATRDRQTVASHAGRAWELTPWLPGEANYRAAPSAARLTAAMRALAQFHQAVAPVERAGEPHPRQLSPGLELRLKTLRAWRSGDLDRLHRALEHAAFTPLAGRAAALIDYFLSNEQRVERQLQSAALKPLWMQPCIRDVWHDHMLFTGEAVTGIIDFGAMRIESVSGDLARLLGSLLADQPTTGRDWQLALDAYDAVRRLTPDERQAVDAFDAANTLLSGMTWLRWIFLEGRRFEDPNAVERRLDELLVRIRAVGS